MNIDGTEIFVEKLSGAGNLNFVLIHNAGSDHRFFTHQIEMLRKFGDVVLLDLPGSGRSHPISSYKMRDLSSIIATICRKLSLKNICLIGLNNGANIAIDTVLHQSLAIEKLILIDPPIFMDKPFVGEINSYIESLEQAEFNHLNSIFLPKVIGGLRLVCLLLEDVHLWRFSTTMNSLAREPKFVKSKGVENIIAFR